MPIASTQDLFLHELREVYDAEHRFIEGLGSYRGLVTGARLMGQTEIERLLSENMRQEEETASIAESSAEELLQNAMQAEGGSSEDKGLVDKAKDTLTGQ